MTTPLSMTEIQPQFARLLRKPDITPVRLGRQSEPVLVIAPWACFLSLWLKRFVAGQYSPAARAVPRVAVTRRFLTEAARAFTSYQRFLAPLLSSEEAIPRIIVIAQRRGNPAVGVIVSWEDWQRFAPPVAVAQESERSYTIVTARKHLAQFPGQFEQEEAAGFREEIMVTQQGTPTFVLLPIALYRQMQERLACAPIQCRICGCWVADEEMDSHLFLANDGGHWLGSGAYLTQASAHALKLSLFALLDFSQQAARLIALLDRPVPESRLLSYFGPTACPDSIVFYGDSEAFLSLESYAVGKQRVLREGILWLASLAGPKTPEANARTLAWLKEWQHLQDTFEQKGVEQ